ncbi:MAG: hypothetical protein ACTSPY_16045 [Candidatus Helarchaeota archaeon]
MRVTTLLKGIVSLVSAAFLILQLLLIGSAAFIKPAYEENWSPFGGIPPIGFITNFNISNQGIFPVQNLIVSIRVYNSSGTILEGSAGPVTIQAFSTSAIPVYLFIMIIGNLTDGDYTLLASVTGIFLWSLISFSMSINYTTTFNFPP